MKKALSLSSLKPAQLNRGITALALAVFVLVASLLFAPLAQASFSDDFTVHTWGSSFFGQLGLGQYGFSQQPLHPDFVAGNAHARNTPTEVPAIEGESEWRSILASSNHTTLAITGDGRMFAWGVNQQGQLGLGGTHLFPAHFNDRTTPQLVPFPATVTAWDRVDTSGYATFAFTYPDGRLFVAGRNCHGVFGTGLGQVNFNIVNNFIPVPFPSGVNAWRDFAVGSHHVLAICNNGTLWSWGSNHNGPVGVHPSENVQFPVTLHSGIPAPIQVPLSTIDLQGGPPIPGWREVFANQGDRSAALTTDGRMFVWGHNSSYNLGLGDTTARHTPTLLPPPPPVSPPPAVPATWAHISFGNNHTHGLSSDGRLFAWGSNAVGQTGLDTTVGHTTAPAQVGSASNWVYVDAGTMFSVALNARGEIFSWGGDSFGRLGQGLSMDAPVPPVTTPTRVGTYYWHSVSVGANHVIAISAPPFEHEFPLAKELNKPYGTPRPTPISFEFSMKARSFDDDYTQSVIAQNFPTGSLDLVRTVTLDNASSSTPASPSAGDVVTISDSTNLLAGINFTRTGTFAWTIEEVQGSSQTTAPSHVTYSQAVYELRVYVRQQPGQFGELYIRYITLTRHTNADGTIPPSPVKVDDDSLTFTNAYTRVTAANQHFEIRKNVTGEFASSNEAFTFEITLTRTGLCPENRTFIGRVQTQNAQGNWVDVSPLRTYTFTTGVMRDDIELSHNQRLIFDGVNAITLGSTFLVTELACPFHIASVRVYSYGTAQPPAPYYLVLNNTTPNQDRTTNTHLIGANRNAALFTNAHQMIPPTGLWLTSGSPYLVLLAAGLLTTAYFSLRARKRIEELPMM